MLITDEILRKVVPLIGNNATDIASLLNDVCPKYGIYNADIMHEFIAQVAHESNSFKSKDENLMYSADRLIVVFGKYFNRSNASSYAYKPQMIANKVYANRLGNGSEASGDGFKYRGGGFIQLTGKDIWKSYAKYVGKTLEEILQLVRTTNHYALDSACWVFAVEKKLINDAIDDLFIKITKRINGGTNGINDRTAFYNRAKLYIKQ